MKDILVHFKSYFFRGLAVLIPTIVTIWIFVWSYRFIRENISAYISRTLVNIFVLVQSRFLDSVYFTKEQLDAFWVQGPGQIAGFVIALVLVCVVGFMLANVVGRTLWRMIERFILNTPLLRQVYPYVKQISDFVFTQEEHRARVFRRVVAVEYPRKGIWSLGFVTGSGFKKISERVEKKILTILIPTSPTPFTGFVIMASEEDTVELDLTIEEALRFIISGGVITPIENNKVAFEPPKK